MPYSRSLAVTHSLPCDVSANSSPLALPSVSSPYSTWQKSQTRVITTLCLSHFSIPCFIKWGREKRCNSVDRSHVKFTPWVLSGTGCPDGNRTGVASPICSLALFQITVLCPLLQIFNTSSPLLALRPHLLLHGANRKPQKRSRPVPVLPRTQLSLLGTLSLLAVQGHYFSSSPFLHYFPLSNASSLLHKTSFFVH